MRKRLALVGVGNWGANFLRTIVDSQQDELTVIVSSKSKPQLDAIAACEAQVIADFSRIQNYLGEIDGAIVATPPQVRPAIVEYLLRLGVPVLAEKPLSLSAATSVELLRLAESLAVPLIEDYIHLYSWPYLRLQEQLQSGRPIAITSKAANWGPFRDYSPLADYAPHDLAMILQVFNRLPQSVQLKIGEIKNKLAFDAEITLDFAELGHANTSISNIKCEKIRQFELIQDQDTWLYDDCSNTRLTRNGRPQTSCFENLSPIQLLLDHFCGRQRFYEPEKTHWLSQSVAALVQQLEAQRAGRQK